MSFYLAIVSPLDSPLFELSFPSAKPPPPQPNSGASTSFPSWSTFTAPNGSDLGGGADSSSFKVQAAGTALLSDQGKTGPERDRALCQMIAHKSLDSIEETMEGTGSLYLKSIDRHNEWIVSAFIATSVKFVLLHDIKNDDGIRLFFIDLWEAYVKILLNPFHTTNTPIRNPEFEAKVRAIARRSL